MAAASLSAKINADIGDFSRNLDVAGRKWEKFGRDLNQGASAMTKTFGLAGGSLSTLSRGFETAGRAAGLFAGLDGLAGLASSMAMGGPLLAGLAAVAAGVAYLGTTAEVNKEKVEKFGKSLDVFYTKGSDVVGTVAATKVLQREYDMLDAKIKKIQDRWAGSMADPFGKAVINKLTGLDKLLAARTETALEMTATGTKHAELTILGAKDAAKAWADELERAAKAAAKAVSNVALIAADPFVRLGNVLGNQPRPGVSLTPQAQPFVDMRGMVVPQPLVDLTHKTDEVKGAINAGFAQLPNALGSVLGGLLIPLFGNSRGAQVGGGLGSAIGAGAGAFLSSKPGAGIGSMIGGALLPVVGGAIGGLLGGVLGGLFGSGKKHMDDLAYSAGSAASALRHFTSELLNAAPGFRVAATRFAASTPMVMGSGGYFVEEGRGGNAGGNGTPIVIQVDGRTLARVVVNTLRTESQAQFGSSLRIAEVSL